MTESTKYQKCIFCGSDLNVGSEEHVFLSALGGRITTRRAICLSCNNAFANDETGKVDDALAECFKHVRNGLKIWSGRNGPPPTLPKAGKMDDGGEFDLAPGFVPVMRKGNIPDVRQLSLGNEVVLTARDEADAERILNILAKQGVSVNSRRATKVQAKVPTVHASIAVDSTRVWRAVAKMATVAFVVLYGNEQAQRFIDPSVRAAIRHGNPSISNFTGWDFTNPWPEIAELRPHDKTPGARASGYEHSVIISDVGTNSVAYITLFGGWRFSALLGPHTGLPTRGLAINPRSSKPARFIVIAKAPGRYVPKHVDSLTDEKDVVLSGFQAAFNNAMQKWSEEAHASYAEDLDMELRDRLDTVGDDEVKRDEAIRLFAEKIVRIEQGEAWITDLDTVLDEDEPHTGP